MCNQAVSLIAAELERHGISTVALQFLKEITKKIRPPRALIVPFKHGYPLNRPGDANRQRAVLEQALTLLEQDAKPPLMSDYVATAEGS